MNDFVEEIYKTIDTMIQRYVSKMKISQQVNGIVQGESKKGQHRYMVKVKDAIYDVRDGIGLAPAPNTSVWVTIPNGDWNLAFICAGRNAETGYVTEEELKSTRAALEQDIQDVYDACVSGGAVLNPTSLGKILKAGTNVEFQENIGTLVVNVPDVVTDVTLNGTSVVTDGVAEITTGGLGGVQDVTVNGSSVVDQTGTAVITIPPTPTIPVTDVKVDNVSVLDGTVAKLSKNDLNIIKDVKVNGGTVVNPAGIANISVTNVVANPSGTASTDLTKLQVGNDIYDIPQSSGTDVEANPTGTATDDLDTIRIGNTIYDIPGSGGSGASHLDGTTAPTSFYGNNGDEYFKLAHTSGIINITSIKFKVTATKDTGSGMNQFSQLGFYDSNNNKYQWPNGTTWTDDVGHYENDPISANDKMLLNSTPGTVTIYLPTGSSINTETYTKFGWFTANDIEDRDPISWELYISEDGINYELADTRIQQTIPSERLTLAFRDTYSGGATGETIIEDIYYKKSGVWLKSNFSSGSSEIIPNPSGDSTTRLIKLGINGTIYSVSAGEGGDNFEVFDYTGTIQTFTAPHTGDYKLEVWGAQGGSGDTNVHGGYGGYSVGTIALTQGDTLYICVGGKGGGSATSDTTVVGYNGGGEANYGGNRGNGGGATHIALSTGTLDTLENNLSDILIVAGGGGGAGYYAGSDSGDGGSGGGYIGGHGLFVDSTTGDSNSHTGSGGTQSTGGETEDYSIQSIGSFGQGANRDDGDLWGGSGGGGGFYGGGASTNNAGAGGGSGYINTTELTNACMFGYNVSESAATATRTVSTLAHSETPTAQTAKIGNGYAKISWEEDFDPYVTVGDLYDACVANNVTPVSHDLNDIIACFLN